MLKSPSYFGTPDHQHASIPSAAVLLVNIGTPQAPEPRAVRRYLAEFLSDPRVIEAPRWLWGLVLHGVILRVRPAQSARNYAKIWTEEGSPLRVQQQRLLEQVTQRLGQERNGPILVHQAMRYGEPAIDQVIKGLIRANVRRLLILPLYPQYSGSSTGATFDAVTKTLRSCRWPPELRFINDYHAEPAYIEALANSVEAHWQQSGRGDRLLLSFHGIPERYFRAGDPYFCHCQATARLLRERLSLPAEQLQVSFQSRVGRELWLRPYTNETLEEMAKTGVRHVQVLCPGFAVDCLETIQEIAIEARTHFLDAGGERFDYIPALNASAAHVQTLTSLILKHGQGWPEFDPQWSAENAKNTSSTIETNFRQMCHVRD